MINLTFFNTDANVSPAGREAYTLLANVQDEDIRAGMYVKRSGVEDDDVGEIRTGLLMSKCQNLVDRWFAHGGRSDRFRFTTLGMLFDRWIRRTDIFQLYNLCGGYFSLPLLPYVVGKRPVVWRMTDLWPITGGCVSTHDCKQWLTGCSECAMTGDGSRPERDMARWRFEEKRKAYRRCNITVVTPTAWMRGMVKCSPLLGECNVISIPTGIDLRTFRPIDKKDARLRLGIPEDSICLLFDTRDLSLSHGDLKRFSRVLEEVSAKGPRNLLLLFQGEEWPELSESVMSRARVVDKPECERGMAAVCSAADVVISPATTDYLHMGIIESLACGTPCVALNAGGITETVEHGEEGLLVEPDDPGAFAHSILRLVYDEELRKYMASRCRNSVIGKHDIREQVWTYRRLYESLLDRLVPPSPIPSALRRNVFSTEQYAIHTPTCSGPRATKCSYCEKVVL